MRLFAHPERASHPLLAPAMGTARPARADGIWVRDGRGLPVLARDTAATALGLVLDVPDALRDALDLLWAGPGISAAEAWVTASLRREPAIAWSLKDVRHARLHGYRLPRSVQAGRG